MKEFLILELATRFGVREDKLKADMHEAYPGIMQFPSLRPHLGEPHFHCVNDADANWLHLVGDHLKAKRHPIFKTFDKTISLLPEDRQKFFVLFIQTPFGPFCMYRARWYAGQGGSLLHRDENGSGYVVEPFDHWFEERTGLWTDDGDDPVPRSQR